MKTSRPYPKDSHRDTVMMTCLIKRRCQLVCPPYLRSGVLFVLTLRDSFVPSVMSYYTLFVTHLHRFVAVRSTQFKRHQPTDL